MKKKRTNKNESGQCAKTKLKSLLDICCINISVYNCGHACYKDISVIHRLIIRFQNLLKIAFRFGADVQRFLIPDDVIGNIQLIVLELVIILSDKSGVRGEGVVELRIIAATEFHFEILSLMVVVLSLLLIVKINLLK